MPCCPPLLLPNFSYWCGINARNGYSILPFSSMCLVYASSIHFPYAGAPSGTVLFLRLPCMHASSISSLMQVSPSGEVLASLWDQQGESVSGVSSVEEHDGRLWLGNVKGSGVSYYDLKPSSSAGSDS